MNVVRMALLCTVAVWGQQNISCVPSAVPPLVRAEGLTERISDLVYQCTGPANAVVTANLTVGLNTNVTNRLSGSALTGLTVTADRGNGPQPVSFLAQLVSASSFAINGIQIPLSSQGLLSLRIAGIRANATRIGVGGQIVASLALNGAGLPFTNSQLAVATTQKSIYAGFASSLVCGQLGSPLPTEITFADLIFARTALASTRFTEGFADAWSPRTGFANVSADAGHRIIMRYSGFPSDARLFVPTAIAGSSAQRQTAGGDFGVPASGGVYAPVAEGSLLLSYVAGADVNGAGGAPVYTPGAVGSGPVFLDGVSELTIAGGAAYAVYEVMDSNPARIESAQFPTFLGLPPDGNRAARVTEARLYLAAVSTTQTATASEAVPRFLLREPDADCAIIGDCATYLPNLTVDTTALNFTAQTGSGAQQSSVFVQNTGGGTMRWSATVAYLNGSGWLSLLPAEGINNTNVRVFALPGGLAAGTYRATITINAGSATPARSISVALVLTTPVPPPPPVPVIQSVVHAATFLEGPVVAGSISTIMGSALFGTNVLVTFDSFPATVLFNNGQQINLLVPEGLAGKASAQLVVSVNGQSSLARTVQVTEASPGIFGPVVFNQNGTVNSASNPADAGSVVVVYATGLPGAGTGRIAEVDIPSPYYTGPAPGIPGVQQMNLAIPPGLTGFTQLSICGGGRLGMVCSSGVPLAIRP